MLYRGTALWPIPIAALIQAKRFPDVTAVSVRDPALARIIFCPSTRSSVRRYRSLVRLAQFPTQLNLTDHSCPRRLTPENKSESHEMEAVGAVFGIVDVALRTSSKAWKLSGVWRDAPAELHRLRDELDRAERFFSETQQGIESLYALSREHKGESHATWSEVERLLGAGVVVLRRIEDFIDSLERPDSQNIGQPLSKTRRIKWMTSARKTTAAREELRGIMANICNLLIAQNM